MSLMTFDLVFRGRVLTPHGEAKRCVGIRDGRISAVEPATTDLVGARHIEVDSDAVLIPGLVDTHVHINDPGRTEWEGFDTATRAAAAGGVTTLIDMPLNSIPPTVDVAALELKRSTAAPQTWVDVGFWGGAIPGNQAHLRELHEAGVFGFKCFLLDSGVPEFPPLSLDEFSSALGEVARLGATMIVHAEDADTIEHAPTPHGAHYSDFLRSRPPAAENRAIAHVIAAAERTGARVHILHLSSAEALDTIAAARRRGVRITVETCPHYLTFTAEDIWDGATLFKCCPPIRDSNNRDLLWNGLAEGVIDCVVSDHSPSTAALKCLDSGDFGRAWGGIAGLQLALPAVWTHARWRGFTLADVIQWMAQRPAELVGLHRKGAIDIGYDADVSIFAPNQTFVVDAATLLHRNPISAYHGRTLHGVVRQTWLRGNRIDTSATPQGALLTRGMP